ncbi:MAG: MBL fold metallo-hydrolase [Verrucomicrobiota bacterium]
MPTDNRDMTLTFLGTGTSVGVPVIGCDCETCRSEDPRDRRTRSSIHLATPEANLIVDTGPDLRAQCLREGISELDAVLYTHAHMDHVTGFDDLRRFSAGADETIDVFARPATMEALKRMFSFAFDGQNRYPGYIKPEENVIDGSFVIGESQITPIEVRHGKVDTVGFLFERGGRKRLAYFPDCKVIEGGGLERLEGVEVLIIDALRHSSHPTHMNFEESLAAVEAIGPERAYFTHIADQVMHARDEPLLPKGVTIAYDGLQFAV